MNKYCLAAFFFTSSVLIAESYKPSGIWKAACKGDLAAVRECLADGAVINERDQRGYTPLHHALNTFQSQVVSELLQLGADPNAKDYDGVTPLSLCARNADAKTMRQLIAAGGKIDVKDLGDNGVPRLALRHGSMELFQLVLDAGFDVNARLEYYSGDTWVNVQPLHYAAIYSNTPVADLLIKNGADVEGRTLPNHHTPLMSAAGNAAPALLQKFLDLGLKTNAVNKQGRGVYDFAARRLDSTSLEVLLNSGVLIVGDTTEVIRRAWRWGDAALLKKLADRGLRPPADDPIEALLNAVRANDIAEVRRLCATGFFDFENEAHCVFAPAAAGGNVAIIAELHKHANGRQHFSCSDASHVTQLHHTVIGGHMEALDFFLANHAKTDQADFAGRTPLMVASMLGRVDAIERLVKAGAKLNDFDSRRYNALDLALHHGQQAAVKALEAHGLKPTPEIEPPAEEPVLQPLPRVNAPLPQITAALTPLGISHETWHQSVAATRDFAALLQAEIEKMDGARWVERAEIDRAEQELGMDSSGLASSSRSLAIGRWVKADVLITGTLHPDEGLGRRITLIAVETRRGDVLARRQFAIAQPPAAPFTITPAVLKQSAAAGREVLAEARVRLAATAGQKVIAPLFIANRSAYTARLDLRAARLIDVFQAAAAGSKLRVLNLQGVTDAQQEAEIAISGLAQAEDDAWQTVADNYLWGWIEETGPITTPFAKMPVKITFELATGEKFTTETTVPEIEVAAKKLAAEVLAALPAAKTLDRRIAANALFEHAKAWSSGEEATPLVGSYPAWLRNRWMQMVKLLDAARFFAPDDATIAAHWLIERWNKAAYFRESDERATPMYFWSLWRRKADWDAHVARFGFKGFPPYEHKMFTKLPYAGGSGASDYPKRCWHGMCSELFRCLSNSHSGRPDGLPPDVRERWLHEISAETARRFMKVVNDPELKQLLSCEDYRLGKLTHYLPNAIRIEVAKVAFEQARKDDSPFLPDYLLSTRERLLYHYDVSGRREEGLESLSLKGLAVREDRLPSIDPPSNPAPTPASAPAPKPYQAKSPRLAVRVEALPLHGPWGDSRNFRIERALSVGAFALLEVGYQPHRQFTNQTLIAAWVPPAKELIPFSPSSFKQQLLVDFFTEAPGEVWLSDKTNGIGRIRLQTKQIEFLKEADGVPFSHGKHGTHVGGELFVAGTRQQDQPLIAAFTDKQGWRLVPTDWKMTSVRRLAGINGHLFCVSDTGGQACDVHVLDTQSLIWRTSSLAKISPHYDSAADHEGLWVVGKEGVTLIPPDERSPSHIPFPSDMRCTAAHAVHDGEWLWIAAQEFHLQKAGEIGHTRECHLLAIHKPTRRYRGSVDLPADSNIKGLLVTPLTLHPILSRYGGPDADGREQPSPVLSLDKAAFIREALAR